MEVDEEFGYGELVVWMGRGDGFICIKLFDGKWKGLVVVLG